MEVFLTYNFFSNQIAILLYCTFSELVPGTILCLSVLWSWIIPFGDLPLSGTALIFFFPFIEHFLTQFNEQHLQEQNWVAFLMDSYLVQRCCYNFLTSSTVELRILNTFDRFSDIYQFGGKLNSSLHWETRKSNTRKWLPQIQENKFSPRVNKIIIC